MVEMLMSLGAERVAGRIIYRGKDLAREVDGRWELLPDGEEFMSDARKVTEDGVEVMMPAEKPTARRGRPPRSAQPSLSQLDDLLEE